MDLGLSDFELDIRAYLDGFRYHIMFRLVHTRGVYSGEGVAASPTQCFDLAMCYLAETIRGAKV
jgi:hypothetical protein